MLEVFKALEQAANVLNALRHQRYKQEALSALVQQKDAVLNALRHQRYKQGRCDLGRIDWRRAQRLTASEV